MILTSIPKHIHTWVCTLECIQNSMNAVRFNHQNEYVSKFLPWSDDQPPRQAPAHKKSNNNKKAKEWVNMTSPLHMTQYSTTKLHQPWPNTAAPMHGDVAGEKGTSDCTFLFQVMYSSLRIARRKDDSLYCGWMRQRAVATMEAVRGPVTPVDVRNSAMLGVSRNGTGRLESRSPKGWKLKREEINKTAVSKCALSGDTGLGIIQNNQKGWKC